jgi:hypothetical protein
MSEVFQKTILSLSEDSLYTKSKYEWMILFKEHKAIDCICGHKVKYSSTIYNKVTRALIDVGTFCCKKYGIRSVCENQLFIRSLREYRSSNISKDNIIYIDNAKMETIIRSHIEEEYNHIFDKTRVDSSIYITDSSIQSNSNVIEPEKGENDYYRIVPLNRLLTDLIDLQTNYQYSFMTHISEIKQDIEILEREGKIERIKKDKYFTKYRLVK